MGLAGLRFKKGAKKGKKRVGCGPGSGHGKTSGRGHKGYKSRAGRKRKPGFEGGQNPLYRRIPKRGFVNINRRQYEIVNLEFLKRFDPGIEITPELLKKKGLIDGKHPLKILGQGSIDKPLKIRAHAFSRSAAAKITQAGGQVIHIR
ncbi:MAG: 50S ribosomal protein L15 [candidate division WOR-3 bacterium]